MKRFLTILILVFIFNVAAGQTSDTFFTDNNPKITKAESNWLNTKFKTENFEFSKKCIGFVELLSGGFYGIGKFTLPLKKKNFYQLYGDKFLYKLFILDSGEKNMTRGYDALLVLVNKRNKGKLQRLNIKRVISETKNRYPQIPYDAGIDTNAVLNFSNSVFFNEVYKADLYPITFDFTGKKVAIFDSHCQFDKIQQVSITGYVEYIKWQLNTYGFSMTEFTYYLTEEQKKESGGYDVIIQYRCKKDLPLTTLIRQLK